MKHIVPFALAIAMLSIPVSATAASHSTPTGPGAVSGAPNLPPGFTGTFTSRYMDVGGVRLHVVVGGKGKPLLLLHGWPQTWYQFRLIMPALARDFTVVVPDQLGIGLSDKPESGYDSGTQGKTYVALMEALGHKRFALIGLDTGMPIAYALAADHPDRVERLGIGEAFLPGIGAAIPLVTPGPVNKRLWHIAFNRLGADVNETLVRGHEDVYFGAEYEGATAGIPLPAGEINYYIERLKSGPNALRGSFGWYRAIDTDIAQNQQRQAHRLTMPVLAISGEMGQGEATAKTVRLVADNVQAAIIPGASHWVAEQAPDKLLAALGPFLAPYREAQ